MEQQVLDIMRESLLLILKCTLPIILTGLCVGLIVSIFQTVTSIQEQTLAFVPKIIAVFLAIIIFGSWIMGSITSFVTRLYSSFSSFI